MEKGGDVHTLQVALDILRGNLQKWLTFSNLIQPIKMDEVVGLLQSTTLILSIFKSDGNTQMLG